MLESYHTISLTLAMLVIYSISYGLCKTGKIKIFNHRKIWNVILLFSFAISGLIGILLAFIIDQKMIYPWYNTFLWTHVEFGIIMAMVAIFHAVWHLNYFKLLLRKNANEKQT